MPVEGALTESVTGGESPISGGTVELVGIRVTGTSESG